MSAPRSELYQDVYFSPRNGLAEKRHVFLDGNNLPENWKNRDDFVIFEAGFGAGLSFLATAQLFLSTTRPHQWLHFMSVELHPINVAVLRDALMPWRVELGPLIDELIDKMPLLVPGWHRIILSDRIFLTLIIGDIQLTLSDIDTPVDAWFLDGFAPARNPAMWGDDVYQAMNRLSSTGATVATYSAARRVRDGLAGHGFEVERVKGYAYKEDMTRAVYSGSGRMPLQSKRGLKIMVQGGGLAGTACAHHLRELGHHPVIVAPKGLAGGASGNARGLYNPKFSQHFTPLAQTYASGFASLYTLLRRIPDLGHQDSGALHVLRDDATAARLSAMTTTWGWGSAQAVILGANDASAQAGINLTQPALWLPQSGSVVPPKLCAYYAKDIAVMAAQPYDYDVIVHADGPGTVTHEVFSTLPLSTVRGQISLMRANDISTRLKTHVCYGGYITPAIDGVHVLGSTFQHWLTTNDVMDDDHAYVRDRLHTMIGPVFDGHDVIGGRAALRVTTPDRTPVIGLVDQSTYISTAHGSHGLITSQIGGGLIADMISGIPPRLPQSSIRALSPQRFTKK